MNVILVNEFGDTQRGVVHYYASDEPASIRVGSTELFETVWAERGWVVQTVDRL